MSRKVLLASFSLALCPDIAIVPSLWNNVPQLMDGIFSSSGQTIVETLPMLSTAPGAGWGWGGYRDAQDAEASFAKVTGI